ncbi:MAG: YIP1 family protein [Phycisphaerae bacterium]
MTIKEQDVAEPGGQMVQHGAGVSSAVESESDSVGAASAAPVQARPTRELLVPEEEAKSPLRFYDALRVYASPGSLFRRVEDTGAYGWSLAILLTIVMLVGAVKVQSGLIDRSVDLQTDEALATLEASKSDLVDRIELKERMDDVREAGNFQKTLLRVAEIGLSPVLQLGSLLLITSVLYVAVAMSGRKPEFHTLMSISVYSAYLPLLASLLSLGMMLYYRTLDVDVSLGRLGSGMTGEVLSVVYPFSIWFWILVAYGTVVTRQLGPRVASAVCVLMALVVMSAQFGLKFAPMG